MKAEQILLQDDIRSAAWRKVKAWAESELFLLNKSLRSDLKRKETAKARGRIRSLELLLALENPPAPALDEDDDE